MGRNRSLDLLKVSLRDGSCPPPHTGRRGTGRPEALMPGSMTITEKILSDHANLPYVSPGDIIDVEVDLALGNDLTAPLAIKTFRSLNIKAVFDPDRIALIPDHFTPNKDLKAAEGARVLRGFALEQGISHYYEVGRGGIEHALLPEEGLIIPGDLILGADSHTCTYGALGAFASGVGSTDLAGIMATGRSWLKVPQVIKISLFGTLAPWVVAKDIILYILKDIGVDGANYKTMEFYGDPVSSLSIDARFTICNMVVEAGAKNGIMFADNKAIEYIEERGGLREPRIYQSDPDAMYSDVREYNVSDIRPQVALPPLPSRSVNVDDLPRIDIDQVVIGSCTNGRIEDLRIAADILKGKTVARDVRLIIIPATQRIFLQAAQEGLIEGFVKAGAVVSPPTCGPCLGGHMGVLADGERALATTNRNFSGRMGSTKSEVYLSGPQVAAASAVVGYIVHPEKVAG